MHNQKASHYVIHFAKISLAIAFALQKFAIHTRDVMWWNWKKSVYDTESVRFCDATQWSNNVRLKRVSEEFVFFLLDFVSM